jgi:hypothetical protein
LVDVDPGLIASTLNLCVILLPRFGPKPTEAA